MSGEPPIRGAIRLAAAASVFLAAGLARSEEVAISEIHYHPLPGKPEYIELTNLTTAAIDIAEWRFSDGIDYTFPGFSAGNPERTFLRSRQRAIVTNVDAAAFRAAYPTTPLDTVIYEPFSGALNNAGEDIALEDKNGTIVSTASYSDDGRWPVAADGTGHSLRLRSENVSPREESNWTASKTPDGTPGLPEVEDISGTPVANPEVDLSTAFPLVDLDGFWRHYHDPAEPGAGWNAIAFDDSGWATGQGWFGFESRQVPELRTTWPHGFATQQTTYYVRKAFTFQGEPDGARISIDAVLDDGAVFYLNGVELGRVRMPAGTITHASAASANSPAEDVVETGVVDRDVSSILVRGTNVLAVSVHNSSFTSSDVMFAARANLDADASSIMINEVLPGAAGVGFVEFYNGGTAPVNLRDHYLTDDPAALTKFQIASDLTVPAGGFASVGFAESGLSASARTRVYLVGPDGATVFNAIDTQQGFGGRSMGRKPSGSDQWFLLAEPSRGAANLGSADLGSALALNEVRFRADGHVDWIELAALGQSAVSAESLVVASRPDLSDAVALSGQIAGGGHGSWNVAFAPDAGGEIDIYLATQSGIVLDAARFSRGSGERSFQAFPPGSGEWYLGATATRDAVNAPERTTSIVINEIMCDPPSDARCGEFIELYNRGASAVDLSGWEFADGISFTFPGGTTLEPGSYLVVAADAARVASVYGGGVDVIGNFQNNLANEGEYLRLEDAAGNLADDVDYRTGGDWPRWTNGDGSSMELVHPGADNSLPTAWRDSDESAKAPFQRFTFTGTYHDLPDERTGGITDYKELHLFLVGDSHIVLRDIRLERAGSDLLSNAAQMSTNNSGSTGWLAQGTHHATHVQGGELHLISDGHGDNRANRAEIDCIGMSAGNTLTLTFEARWVMGKNRLVAQTFDHSFVFTPRIPIPDNLGTPGAPNSIVLSEAPPVIANLVHQPAVPRADQDVVVSAQVSNPAGAAPPAVTLVYRPDSLTGDAAWQSIPMNDAGVSGDAAAGDATFSARITDQRVEGRIVEFYVRAESAGGAAVTQPSEGAALPALYVVDSRTISSDLMKLRWVISEYDRRAFQSGVTAAFDHKFPLLSAHYRNMTLIIDESEIIYNCEIRPTGSPWHTGNRTNLNLRSKFKVPKSHRFRNREKFGVDNTPGAEGFGALFHNRLPRYWLYLLGYPESEDEMITVLENTLAPRHAVELFEPPSSNDYLERHFGDQGPQGDLFKIDDIFRFTDADINSTSKTEITNRFWWYAGDQWEGPGRYHTQWMARSREADYDYSSLIRFLRTVSSNQYSDDLMDRMLDPEGFGKLAAVRGYIADWDNITLDRPKNAYFYRPPDSGQFMIFHHDSDLAFQGNHINDGLVATHGNNVEMRNYVNRPRNRRIFRYYVAKLIDEWTDSSPRLDTWFQLENDASTLFAPNSYAGWFTSRNSNALSQLGPNANLGLAVDPAPGTVAGQTLTLTGTGGYRMWEAAVVGHPEAAFRWIDETAWEISGIVLQQGGNSLEVIALDDEGNPVASLPSRSLTVTKSGNALPLARIATDPPSGRLSVAAPATLDASASADPDGGALTFAWTPPDGLGSFAAPGGGPIATATFSQPGIYLFILKATDPGGGESTAISEVAAYGPGGFSSFSDPSLEPFWTAANVTTAENTPAGAGYTLAANEGKLTLFLPESESAPLAGGPSELPDPVQVFGLDAAWKYDDSGTQHGTEFAAPGFDDSAWLSGPGMFGFGEVGALQAPGQQSVLTRRVDVMSYFFRKRFDFAGEPVGSRIVIDGMVDDGVRFFLNGIELGRLRLPAGAISASTPAERVPVEDTIEFGIVDADGTSYLVPGENVLAAEVHNETTGSSDLVLGTILKIAARPAGTGGGGISSSAPWIKRQLPPTADWTLETDVELLTLQTGSFFAGLQVEMTQNGQPIRYAWGMRDGDSIALLQINSSGALGEVASIPFTSSDDVELRIQRAGDSLHFGWRNGDGLFTAGHSLALALGAAAGGGGITAATEEAAPLQVAFDFVMLIEPEQVSPALGLLLLTEIMYKPSGGTSYEYLELFNSGAVPIDLAGYKFPEGDPFGELVIPANSVIQPGAFGLIVSDPVAFETRYGGAAASRILTRWTGGNLSNSGETITLLDNLGRLVFSVDYSDAAPWPTGPDETGQSLVLTSMQGSLSDAASWSASASVGGSPGASEPALGETFAEWMNRHGYLDPLGMPQGSGVSHLLAYALAADLRGLGARREAALPRPIIVTEGNASYPAIEFRRRTGDPAVVITVETSLNGATWAGSAALVSAPTDHGDGSETVRYRASTPIGPPGSSAAVMRVRASLQ